MDGENKYNKNDGYVFQGGGYASTGSEAYSGELALPPADNPVLRRLGVLLPEKFWWEVRTTTLDLWILEESDIEEILINADPEGEDITSEPISRVSRDGKPRKGDGGNFDLSSELFEWAHALVVSLVVMVLMFTLIFRVIGVDGQSMVPTLFNNDKMLVSNLFYEPKNGDIIVFTKKGLRIESFGDRDRPLVKRVIACEGQRVYIDFEAHNVYVDGVLLDEPYINEPTALQLDMNGEVTVPEGYVFVMGDNRNHSMDSRDSSVGFIDKRYILGKVLARVFPFDNISFLT